VCFASCYFHISLYCFFFHFRYLAAVAAVMIEHCSLEFANAGTHDYKESPKKPESLNHYPQKVRWLVNSSVFSFHHLPPDRFHDLTAAPSILRASSDALKKRQTVATSAITSARSSAKLSQGAPGPFGDCFM
jgi:hypothetical protein